MLSLEHQLLVLLREKVVLSSRRRLGQVLLVCLRFLFLTIFHLISALPNHTQNFLNKGSNLLQCGVTITHYSKTVDWACRWITFKLISPTKKNKGAIQTTWYNFIGIYQPYSYRFGYSKLFELRQHCVSNLTLLFKIVRRKSQFKVIASLLVICQCRGTHKISKLKFFYDCPSRQP